MNFSTIVRNYITILIVTDFLFPLQKKTMHHQNTHQCMTLSPKRLYHLTWDQYHLIQSTSLTSSASPLRLLPLLALTSVRLRSRSE